ncbi:MAG TPA: hypothetical protein VGS27_33765 [Candidatus Sulfotelmatobacter sp.]|nr:hypothetical protein [Candidatus Sulfotelmatobacter sp.]
MTDALIPNPAPTGTAVLEVKLIDLGYRTREECKYFGTGIPRDLRVLNDDYKRRIVFFDAQAFVVYQSHCVPEKNSSSGQRSIEAFFVDAQTGKLISTKTWESVQRRWLNERWDTQARVFAVDEGFVIHAGQSLISYSTAIEKRAELSLQNTPKWAITVAPGGRTIHLQRIENDNQAEGHWLTSDTLEQLRGQHEVAGIVSASDHAVLDPVAHCVQLQTVGEDPFNVYCSDVSRLGLPLFLTDSEFISHNYNGFSLWTTAGDKLWEREASKGQVLGDVKRSLQGNRFAQLTHGPIVFDGVKIPPKRTAILVYDRQSRQQVFQLVFDDKARTADFDLSPDGSVLALLVDDVVRLYKLPK